MLQNLLYNFPLLNYSSLFAVEKAASCDAWEQFPIYTLTCTYSPYPKHCESVQIRNLGTKNELLKPSPLNASLDHFGINTPKISLRSFKILHFIIIRSTITTTNQQQQPTITTKHNPLETQEKKMNKNPFKTDNTKNPCNSLLLPPT